MTLTIVSHGSTARLQLAQQDASQPAAKTPAATPEPVPQQQIQPEQVQKAAESLRQLVEVKAPDSIAFSVDGSTGRTVITITDLETGETIRQIPPEELLEIARSLDKMEGAGVLLQQQA